MRSSQRKEDVQTILGHKYECRKPCTQPKHCSICNSNHQYLLHRETQQAEPRAAMTATEEKTGVILVTAMVKVLSSGSESALQRALIDQRSQIASISEEAVQLLGPPEKRSDILILELGCAVISRKNYKTSITIKQRFSSNDQVLIEALILPHLTTAQPSNSFRYNEEDWRNRLLADQRFNKSDQIDIIIGADVIGSIIEDGIHK